MAHYSLIFLVVGLFSHAVTARPQGVDQHALNSMVLGMMNAPPAPSCSAPPAMDPASAVRYMMETMNEGKPAPVPPIILVAPPMMPPPMMPPPMMMPPVVMSPYLMGPPMGPPPTTEAPKPEPTPEPTPDPTAAPEPVTESAGEPVKAQEEPKPIIMSGPLPPEVVEETTTPRSSEPTEYTTVGP